QLNGAKLGWAHLSEARLERARLTKARLFFVDLEGANLTQAELQEAGLAFVALDRADLTSANLDGAKLEFVGLVQANLSDTSLAGSSFAGANFSYSYYSPRSAPPASFSGKISGLSTIRVLPGETAGLAQLRDLLQKTGLRDLEREITFAIESSKTEYVLDNWRDNPGSAAEAVFRTVALDWTTSYGLEPGHPLLGIVFAWAILTPIYAWPIWRKPVHSIRGGGIYRVLPKDRIEIHDGKPSLDTRARVELLHVRGWATLGWSAYFSLLSAFHIGF